jgi:hypothetical protein
MASSIASTMASPIVTPPCVASKPGSRLTRTPSRFATSSFPQTTRRERNHVSQICHASSAEIAPSSTSIAARPPPTTISGASSEAKQVLRLLREASSGAGVESPKRVRIELPLPLSDFGSDDVDKDVLAFAGFGGQASDWSGGMAQRFRVTKGLIDDYVLDGYENDYLGLLDRDADGMGVWRVGGGDSGGHDCTLLTHAADTTGEFLIKLIEGEYGSAVAKDTHLIVVVNAFWTGSGENVGQPWEFALRKKAREVLNTTNGGWEKVYCARRVRSAAGVEGTLVRRWPSPWRLWDDCGVEVVLETNDEPSNRQIATALNANANVGDPVGFNVDAAATSRDDNVIT